MATKSPPRKRKDAGAPISPPPLKKAVKSTTTKSAVASFFTPASQKPKDRTVWSERGPTDDVPATLLVGRYQPENDDPTSRQKRRKIAAFDLDSTLITTSSGKKHASSGADWKWWNSKVPGRLRELYEKEGYHVAILSNQAGLKLHFDAKYKGPKAAVQKRVADFKQKCNAVLTALDLPIALYAATEKDIYRKPRTGMWKELCEDLEIPEGEVDLKGSFFVGDAGGRVALLGKGDSSAATAAAAAVPKDFSCSDRNFAHNVGIDYKTPEEFFLGEEPRDFIREFDLVNFAFPEDEASLGTAKDLFEKKNDQDVVLFCGPPGAGKSTFYFKVLKPLGYERVNQDTLKTRDKCIQAAKDLLKAGKSVAVDNTNPDPDTRALWIEVARKASVPIRCVWFSTPVMVCEHNDAVRAHNAALNPEARESLPKLAFTGFASRFKEPKEKEGFQDVTEVKFQFRGTKEEYALWGRYWI
ncbi:PNK3P domain-containing protein [Trichoderma aethiopicum]